MNLLLIIKISYKACESPSISPKHAGDCIMWMVHLKASVLAG